MYSMCAAEHTAMQPDRRQCYEAADHAWQGTAGLDHQLPGPVEVNPKSLVRTVQANALFSAEHSQQF